MSWDTQKWAKDQQTGRPACKMLLIVLASYADERHSCFPSQAELADVTELSERAVRENLKLLEDGGFIVRRRDWTMGRRRGLTRYVLPVGTKVHTQNHSSKHAAELRTELDRQNQPRQSGSAESGIWTGRSRPFGPAESASKPLREQPKESLRERARARGEEGPLLDPEGLSELQRAHPTTEHDSRPDTETAWRALSAADRAAARKHHAAWLESRGKRTATTGLPTYLRERRWEILVMRKEVRQHVSAPDVGKLEVKRFSRGHWALFWRAFKAGKNPHDFGLDALCTPMRLTLDEAPSATEEARLVQIEVDSRQATTWAVYVRYRFPIALWALASTHSAATRAQR